MARGRAGGAAHTPAATFEDRSFAGRELPKVDGLRRTCLAQVRSRGAITRPSLVVRRRELRVLWRPHFAETMPSEGIFGRSSRWVAARTVCNTRSNTCSDFSSAGEPKAGSGIE